jgi:hypothetical protein
MTYYILLPGDTEKDCMLDSNTLGEASFNKFYTASGYRALEKLIRTASPLLEQIKIKRSDSKTLSIEEFLTEIQKLTIW